MKPISRQNLPAVFSLLLVLLCQISMPAAAEGISKQQAVTAAQQANPGRVLAVRQNGNTYTVKILNAEGEVRVIMVDAESGKVLSGR